MGYVMPARRQRDRWQNQQDASHLLAQLLRPAMYFGMQSRKPPGRSLADRGAKKAAGKGEVTSGEPFLDGQCCSVMLDVEAIKKFALHPGVATVLLDRTIDDRPKALPQLKWRFFEGPCAACVE